MFLQKPLHRTQEVWLVLNQVLNVFFSKFARSSRVHGCGTSAQRRLSGIHICIYDVYLCVPIYLQHQQLFFTLGKKHNQFATLSCSIKSLVPVLAELGSKWIPILSYLDLLLFMEYFQFAYGVSPVFWLYSPTLGEIFGLKVNISAKDDLGILLFNRLVIFILLLSVGVLL